MAAQVALKRQQAAEDAMVLNMRAVTTGEEGPYLPQGPIVGLPHDIQGGQETNAERRIRGRLKEDLMHLLELMEKVTKKASLSLECPCFTPSLIFEDLRRIVFFI